MKRINIFSVRQVKERCGSNDIDSTYIRCPKDAANIAQLVLDLNDLSVEKFGIITLTTKNQVAGIHVISVGTLNASLGHPREVFKAAILNNAASLICFDNHPSGDPTPSSEDITMTKRLVESGALLGIEVLDHVVTGDDGYISLKEKGMM